MIFEQYWAFAAVCLILTIILVRLILHERITLQGSLTFLVLLGVGTLLALFPGAAHWLTRAFGFTLPSNFFFAVCIAALAILQVSSLITVARVELRSIALTQEVAILQERLERALRSVERPEVTREGS